ncbi:MAG: UDP-N-acetylmuramoyl-L-alanyl-D-glutamate--2,6-diaminopimelate ligase [Chitinispirillales bacterium]|jgi:UDP-N-acetylmuramoyl-L-alanyl-D-glutamate--2,6-diaminopimelate ligase|nr:UDP-N-acetylmuramoyl-L-alanyl-D-glutamate--2,6-diaminopimelate ligase [Chitinispirillales bacterium]
MTFDKLLDALGTNVIDKGGIGNPVVNGIVYDSRIVKPGAVYVAIPGMKVHGDMFIKQAVKDGAVAVISENRQEKLSVPWAAVSEIRAVPGIFGRLLWGIDLAEITSVGITGTNGKTTVSYLYKNLFDRLVGEECSWMFGTVENKLGLDVVDATHTTPESVDIFRWMDRTKIKPKALSMEVSSHSLKLKRVARMEFDVAVWTNLTQEHLDFHGSMEEYYMTKKLLFTDYIKICGIGVVNIDDEYGRRLYEELKTSKKLLTYGRNDDADVKIVDYKCGWDGTTVVVNYKSDELVFTSSLCGFFNVYNMTAMISGALGLNIDTKIIADALAKTKTVSGRMDRVDMDAQFTVVVDYAHTPDALVNILKTASDLTEGRMICVFGCGGDRDKTKRPLMAKVVAENCDMTVVTSDNPRTERPEAIINDILQGMPLDFPHYVIKDRREAIKCALRNARAGDCVVIAGKGHETYQEISNTRHHFDDREEAVKLYNELRKDNAA